MKLYKKESRDIFQKFNLSNNPSKNEILRAIEYAFNNGAIAGIMDGRVRQDAEHFFGESTRFVTAKGGAIYKDGGTRVYYLSNGKAVFIDKRINSNTYGEPYDAYPAHGKKISLTKEEWRAINAAS